MPSEHGRVHLRRLGAGLVVVLLAYLLPIGGSLARPAEASTALDTDGTSYTPAISGDGRYVAFASYATNLAPGDPNAHMDIFVYDRAAGLTTRVSASSSGVQGNGHSYRPSISADGRFIAFDSKATNLVTGDTNATHDVFVFDRAASTTSRVSLSSAGAQGDSHSYAGSISGDGRYVAFSSDASNLVAGDTNGTHDALVHDRAASATTRVSITSSGTQTNGPSSKPRISPDGRYVAFTSYASDLVANDTNNQPDIFVHDRVAATTTRISVSSSSAQANRDSYDASISGDGRYVAFTSYASNLVPDDTNGIEDVFVHDRVASTTTRASVSSSGAQSDARSYTSSISADGRYVAFASYGSNLAGATNGLRHIFEHDLLSATTARLSFDDVRGPANRSSSSPSISADGNYTAFATPATNFDDDTNQLDDIYVHRWEVADGGTPSASATKASPRVETPRAESAGSGSCTDTNSLTEGTSVTEANSTSVPHEVCVVLRASRSLARVLADKEETEETGEEGTCDPPYHGGLYKYLATRTGCERHHMPSQASFKDNSAYTRDCTPSIQMKIIDHRKTASHPSEPFSNSYRLTQQTMVDSNNFNGAFEKDVQDIESKFPGKYSLAISEARLVLSQSGSQC